MLAQSKEEHEKTVPERMKKLANDINLLNSKLACIKFKIERKCIKNAAREQRRQSIHKLENEKNLQFHPKKDRSKSIPSINMNMRLEALRDMKEDLLMRRWLISDEIKKEEVELKVPVLEYCYNDIKRQIMPKPIIVKIKPESP